MVPLAYFGIESSGLNLVIDLLIVFVVVVYLSLVYWTYMDARRRIEDPMLIGCAVAASLFPFVGTIVYVILRPPEYLEDVRERELEIQAAQARLYELDNGSCPHCGYRIERDFIRCPSCLRKLKEPCVSCGRPLDRTWAICPYCEAQVPDAAPVRRRRRRRASVEDSPAFGDAPSLHERPALDEGASLVPEPAPVLREDRRDERSALAAPQITPANGAADDDGKRPLAASEEIPSRPREGRSRYPRSGS